MIQHAVFTAASAEIELLTCCVEKTATEFVSADAEPL